MSQSRRPSSISSDFKKRYGSVKDSYAAAAIAAFAREIDIDPFAGACATPTKELISWESASPGTLESHALLISQFEACSSGSSLTGGRCPHPLCSDEGPARRDGTAQPSMP